MNLEGVYIITERKNGRTDDEFFRYSVGLEYRLAEGVWIGASFGGETGGNRDNELFMLGNLKWALTPEPAMKF